MRELGANPQSQRWLGHSRLLAVAHVCSHCESRKLHEREVGGPHLRPETRYFVREALPDGSGPRTVSGEGWGW